MTDKTDIEALRKAAEFLEGDEWHAEGNSVCGGAYDSGDCVCYDHIASCESINGESPNAEFIALANPATIIFLLDQLEAERQRADDLEQSNDRIRQRWVDEVSNNCDAGKRVSELEAELAELRGEQEPFRYVVVKEKVNIGYTQTLEDADFMSLQHGGVVIPLYTSQSKHVVVLPKSHYVAGCADKSMSEREVQEAMQAAGIVVQDGE